MSGRLGYSWFVGLPAIWRTLDDIGADCLLKPPFLHRPDDGMDRPALPVLPSPAYAPRPDLHGDDHHRCGAARRPRAAHGLLAGRASTRAPARRLRSASTRPLRAHRRGFWL